MNEKPQRTYKDRLFCMIFSDKKELLALYNAMNGTHYEDPEDILVTTLENAIYMKARNDLSFLIDSRMPLYEHQSTYNPNLPLRDLHYVSDLLSVKTREDNLYGSKLIKIPTPQFVVFYNGTAPQPERKVLKLSDAFEIQQEEVSLELKVLVLNINPGYNTELMEKCKTLRDYMCYVDKMRTYVKEMSIEQAVERAINECIKDDILAEFLRKNRAEAKNVSIYEYDEEKHMRQVFAEGRDEGLELGTRRGREEGITLGVQQAKMEQIKKKLAKNQSVEQIAEALEETPEYITSLIQSIAEEKQEPD